jgi:phage terminase large subunit-like protein
MNAARRKAYKRLSNRRSPNTSPRIQQLPDGTRIVTPPIRVGKKEHVILNAKTATKGTIWEELLDFPPLLPLKPGLPLPQPWDLSTPDWERRLKARRSLIPNLPIDLDMGNRAVRVFSELRLADVPGTPTMGEAGGEWFNDIVRVLFGSLDKRTQQRMIRELFLLVPKKNSKTTNGALLMLTAMLLNRRPNGTMIMTAPVHDVAQLAFDAAAGAIHLDPVLSKLFHVREHVKTIVHRLNGTELQIMTFDPSVLTGQKPLAVLIDELHVVSRMSKAPSAIRQLRGGMLPFPEAFMAFITTQSEDPPVGVFKIELQKARDIRDGKQAGVMLPIMYEFPEAMQRSRDSWANQRNWDMITPNAGRSISIPRLVEDFATASATGDAELRAWASQHLNVEIGIALRSDNWIGADFWTRQPGSKAMTLDHLLTHSEVVTVGIDGGGMQDMLGMAVVGRDVESGAWLHWAHAWIHPIVLERRKAAAQAFGDFERDGDLTIVANPGEDVTQVADYVERIETAGLLDRVGVDQAGIGGIVDAIVDKGIEFERVVGISQGWKLVGAIKTTERKLAEGALHHGNSRMMAWCVGNAVVEPRGNAIIITKQSSGDSKIDPLMATFNAVALMAMNPKPQKKAYEVLFM